MGKLFIGLFLALGLIAFEPKAQAVSVCYNNVCGQIVCHGGCVQQSVNGVCVANYCTGRWGMESPVAGDAASLGYCVSCSGGCCASGYSFLQAERACKARCGAFGCFTRCN